MTAARVLIVGVLMLLGTGGVMHAQTCPCNTKVISNKDSFLQLAKNDPRKKMVALKQFIPGIVIDMPYATAHNFTKAVLYHNPVAYLYQSQAIALKQVQEELNKKGLALKIYDAYRPFSVTCKMWRLVPDRRYAANPRKGSNHNRALAVDLTIIDLKTGRELDMGTSFDNFTDTAHHDFYQLPAQVLANRRLLKGLMRKYGFNHVPTEWWHYHWRAREGYEVLDLSFDVLKEIVK